MSVSDRLRRLADTLPAGASVVLTREGLEQLLAAADDELGVDLTAAQAAALLGVSPSQVRRLLETGYLRGYKRPGGSTWYVPAGAVGEFRAGQAQGRPTLRAIPVRRRQAG